MKLLYDISLLARGQNLKSERTGLYRFSEETLKHLLNFNDIELSFTTSQLNFREAKEYIDQNFPQHSHKLLLPPSSIWNTCLSLLQQTLNKLKKFKLISTKANEIYHHLGFIFIFCKIKFPLIPDEKKDLYDVYFSPKYHIPPQINELTNIKKILFLHDMIPILYPQYSRIHNRFLYRNLINSISYDTFVLCNSRTTEKDFLKIRKEFPKKMTKIIPLCASENFKPIPRSKINPIKQKYAIPLYSNYFISVSSLNPRKNITHIVKAFSAFIERYKIDNLHLVLVGPKIHQHDTTLQSHINNIIFTEFVEEQDLPSLYSGAIASINASLYEGFGYPALESMQCGTPAIVSDNSSLAEIVSNKSLLISTKKQEDLILALYKLYHDPNYRKISSNYAIMRAKAFAPNEFKNKLYDFLSSLR